jgi:anti-sigma factor RsiW
MSQSIGNWTLCRSKIQRLISPYIDNEIDAKDRVKLETHLNKCPKCKEIYQNLLLAKNAVKLIRIPPPAEPPEFPERLLKKKISKFSGKKLNKKEK